VVGAGMTGISAALKLARSGVFEVSLFEKAKLLGGMSGVYRWNGSAWDRFYHVILSTDEMLLDFIREIGLEKRLFWRDTRSAFFGDGKLVSMSTTMDFVRFPFLSLWQKFRLGMGILYSTWVNDPEKLDGIGVRPWLIRIFGKGVYERIWDPLLRSKLGSARERASAAFIWATINRLYGARTAESRQEKMGHVHGGYKAILEAVELRLKRLAVQVLPGTVVTGIEPARRGHTARGRFRDACSTPLYPQDGALRLLTNGGKFLFDRILLTTSCPAVLEMVKPRGRESYWDCLEKVDYLGVVCLFLVIKNSLSPYYVVNLLDKTLPFTGVIEATNIVDPAEVGDVHLVYLPRYLTADDPVNRMSDGEISERFLEGLKRIYPHFSGEEVVHAGVFREQFVQPLQEVNCLQRRVGFRTPIKNLYLVNSSMIYNTTLNNNAVVALAGKAVQTILEDVRGAAS